MFKYMRRSSRSARSSGRTYASGRAGLAPARSSTLCTVYLSSLLTSCRRLLAGGARDRSVVRGGARAPATLLSQTSCFPSWRVQREVLRDVLLEGLRDVLLKGLQHVAVHLGLLEQRWRYRTSASCEP